MPTTAGIPIDQLPGGINNPVDWLDGAGDMPGIIQSDVMRGTPGMAAWQRRQIPQRPVTPQAREMYFQAPQWDRGAGAFAPKFGVVAGNPIGAGVYAPYRIPTIAGPGARYEFAAIWFDVQTVPTSVQISPSMSQESLDALIATSYVAGTYLTTG